MSELNSKISTRRGSLRRLAFLLFALATPTLAAAQLQLADALVWLQGQGAVPGTPSSFDQFGSAFAIGDFNGDGRKDLAIGSPGDRPDGPNAIGSVLVIYQNETGLQTTNPAPVLLRQGVAGVPGNPESGDFWGGALAAGDFNADGRADLAIGARGESVGDKEDAGAVTVLVGLDAGFGVGHIFHMDTSDKAGVALPSTAQASDGFGSALASGDFDGDGRDDLAIGIPRDEIPLNAMAEPGTIQVLYGSSFQGLLVRPTSTTLGRLSAMTLGFDPEAEGLFGFALAAADFDRDGFVDLAVGSPGVDSGPVEDSGAFYLFKGRAEGLGDAKLSLITGNIAAGATTLQSGAALVAADFDGDTFPDLAIGQPAAKVGAIDGAGRVRLLYGEPAGLLDPQGLADGRRWRFDGAAQSLTDYGSSLGAGDFDGDGKSELVVGANRSTLPSNAGVVQVRTSDDQGPSATGRIIRQGLDGLIGSSEEGDRFGAALATGDLNGDTVADLAIGIPFKASGAAVAGRALVIPGKGLTCTVDDQTSCLQGGRFRVGLKWQTASASGVGHPVATGAPDSGLFWFFSPNNWEMQVKVLDGCGINDRFWVYAAATTDVGYRLEVEDTWTGVKREFVNQAGQAAQALAETNGFATCGATKPQASAAALAVEKANAVTQASAEALLSCGPGIDNKLCIQDGRFEVSVIWRTPAGTSGAGKVVPVGNDDSGLFWFFQQDNWELLVKVLDGCDINNRFWVFAAATTDVEYDLKVFDKQSGQTKIYKNPLGTLARAVTDTGAFATCK